MIATAVALETERLRLETFCGSHAAAILAYSERNRAHLEPWEPRRDLTAGVNADWRPR